MLIYPPGEIYQRGEDRCQINVEASVANSLRACNDLGYISSSLRKDGYEVFLKDYPAENLKLPDFLQDVKSQNPDVIFISTTNGSIFDDIKTANLIKQLNKDIIIILKGAVFFNIKEEILNSINLSDIDYLIGGESEFIAPVLIEAVFNDKKSVEQIQGISYKKDGIWQTNNVISLCQDIDSLLFPDRELMNNKLYTNPLTNKPMATIATSRGCPFECIYCLSPVISGTKIRYRSPISVFNEISECFNKYGINDFFFKSDTFTANKKRVFELCDLIISSGLNKKINWCANSRVNTIDEETIIKMKTAGCSLIALGIESGSSESLEKMKKGITVEDSIKAVKLIKKHNIKIFGFYLIGFPWETKKHFELTKKLMFKLDTDFIELSIVTPFAGTPLFSMMFEDDYKHVFGKDSFKYIYETDKNISLEELIKYRKQVILEYHLRLSYILKKLFCSKITPELLFSYIKYGIRMIKNNIF